MLLYRTAAQSDKLEPPCRTPDGAPKMDSTGPDNHVDRESVQAAFAAEDSIVEIRIQSRNMDLNPRAENYIQRKFDRIERHLRNIDDAKIEVSRNASRPSRERVQAQVTLNVGGYTLRGQDSGVNLFAAVDAVTDVIDTQARRFKGKVYRSAQAKKARRGFREVPLEAIVDTNVPDEEDVLEEIGEVVRTKRFAMTPMSVEDAILQMEMLGHSFFLFFNIDSNGYNVVYRRSEGDYGLIEPELV